MSAMRAASPPDSVTATFLPGGNAGRALGQENGGLQHLVEVMRADDASALKIRVVEPVLAGEAASMRLHERAAFGAGAQLERDDALAAARSLQRRFAEALRVPDRLEEQQDDLDAVVACTISAR